MTVENLIGTLNGMPYDAEIRLLTRADDNPITDYFTAQGAYLLQDVHVADDVQPMMALYFYA